jgi:hypothetical protein
MNVELREYEKQTYNDLILSDYSIFGSFDFRNPRHSLRERGRDRIKITKNFFKIMAIQLGLPSGRAVCYYLKDEVSGGIDYDEGRGHIHFLLSLIGFENLIKKYGRRNALIRVKTKLKKVSARYGIHKIKEYDYDVFGDRGIRYTLKTQKHQKIVYSGEEDYSKGLRVEIARRKKIFYNL